MQTPKQLGTVRSRAWMQPDGGSPSDPGCGTKEGVQGKLELG